MDPDGALGVREHFESLERPGELVSQDEYWGWIFNHSIPGLPEAAKEKGLSPLEYMKRIGACLLYTSPSPRDQRGSRMPSSA